jgi:hypothetical protein
MTAWRRSKTPSATVAITRGLPPEQATMGSAMVSPVGPIAIAHMSGACFQWIRSKPRSCSAGASSARAATVGAALSSPLGFHGGGGSAATGWYRPSCMLSRWGACTLVGVEDLLVPDVDVVATAREQLDVVGRRGSALSSGLVHVVTPHQLRARARERHDREVLPRPRQQRRAAHLRQRAPFARRCMATSSHATPPGLNPEALVRYLWTTQRTLIKKSSLSARKGSMVPSPPEKVWAWLRVAGVEDQKRIFGQTVRSGRVCGR